MVFLICIIVNIKINIMLDFCDDIDVPPINIVDLYKTIDNSVPNNMNSKQYILMFIETLCSKNNVIIDEFKKISIELLDIVIDMSKNHLLVSFRQKIIDEILKNPKKIIDTFVINAYLNNNATYRRELIIGNENFFLNADYGSNEDTLGYIFQFKTFWGKLNEKEKILLKTYLITLCCYSDKRFILFNIYQKLKTIYPNYSSIYKQYENML